MNNLKKRRLHSTKKCPPLLYWHKRDSIGTRKFRVKWADFNSLIKRWVKELMTFLSLLVNLLDVITFGLNY